MRGERGGDGITNCPRTCPMLPLLVLVLVMLPVPLQ